MVWMLLWGCSAPEPLDVRSQLESPTAQLDAELIPQVADDWMRNVRSYGWQQRALDLIDLARGDQARSPGLIERSEPGAKALLGDAVCVSRFLVDLATYDACNEGETCEAELTFRSCLMSDVYANGRVHFRVTHEPAPDHDRGLLEIDFDNFRTDGERQGFATDMDGVLSVEAASFHEPRERQELIYTADFRTRELDMNARGVFGGGVTSDVTVRAGMGVVFETTEGNEESTVEMLAFVDEDGDGEAEASVVLRLRQETLVDGDLVGVTVEIEGAAGAWTCTWDSFEEVGEDLLRYGSSGTCTDPDGNTVGFAGEVDSSQ